MAALEFFVVSSSVSIDQQTNRVSVFEIIEEVQARALPAILPQMVAVALFMMDDDEIGRDFQITVRIHPPSGASPPDARMNFTAGSARHRITLRLQGLAFGEIGPWRVELLLNGDHSASHTIQVSQGS